MKKIIFLFSLMAFVHSIAAQTNFSYPELFSNDTIVLLCVHNKQLVTLKKDKDKKIVLSVNNKTDTIKVDFPVTYWKLIPSYYNYENNIYIQTTYYKSLEYITNVYKLNLDTKTFSKIEELGGDQIIYYLVNDIFVLSKRNDNNVYGYNVETMRLDSLFYGGEWGFFVTTNFLIEHQTLVGYYESGDIENFSLYDFSNKQETYPLEQLDNLSYYDKGRINTYFKDITEKYYNIGLFWIDKDFNVIQPTLLPKRNGGASFNIRGLDTYYYRNSYIEERNRNKPVWVACKFTLAFDKALYDIYNNTALSKSDVEKFDDWELNKLRNMIFAKHGYQFQSEYLQAFFNLFNFYNNVEKKDDVNNLLTPTDKKNLQLIQQVSKMNEKKRKY